jgi:hypothetical protein
LGDSTFSPATRASMGTSSVDAEEAIVLRSGKENGKCVDVLCGTQGDARQQRGTGCTGMICRGTDLCFISTQQVIRHYPMPKPSLICNVGLDAMSEQKYRCHTEIFSD